MKNIDIEQSISEKDSLILNNQNVIITKNKNRTIRVHLCCLIPLIIIIISLFGLLLFGIRLLEHNNSKKHGVHMTNFTFANNYKISLNDNKKYITLCESKSELYGNCYFDCKCYETTLYDYAVNFGEIYCGTNQTINGYIYKTKNNDKDKACVLDNPNEKIHNELYISRILFALLIIGVIILLTYQITKCSYKT